MQLFVLLDYVTSKFRNTINLVLKFSESDDLFDSSHRAVINDGRLLSTAAFYVAIHSIVAHVQLSSNKPDRNKHNQPTGSVTILF